MKKSIFINLNLIKTKNNITINYKTKKINFLKYDPKTLYFLDNLS